MEKKEIGIDNPVAVAGVTLVPVVQISLDYRQVNGGSSFFATKQPIGIVATSPSGKKAFLMSGEEVSLDHLSQEVPGLKEKLERL